MIRVLIVDDHALFRDSVARALSVEPDMQVAADCGTVADAMAVAESHPIDVVLLDYDLGPQSGTDFLAAARLVPGFVARVIIVTAAVSDAHARLLIRDGVDGIFFKEKPLRALLASIRAVAAGMAWFEARHLRPILDGSAAAEPKFTDRERHVIKGVTQGLTNKKIAAELAISEAGVKAALQRLFQKTDTHTRGQLVRVILEQHRDVI